MTLADREPRSRFAVVIQRFGKDLGGGAEEHARVLARALQSFGEVEILTTCARSHHSWRNEFLPGLEIDAGLPVRRFPTARRKNRPLSFLLSRLLFRVPHPAGLEDLWLTLLGPHSPALLDYISTHRRRYRGFLFYTYLYPISVRGLPLVRDRAVLIPTAHDEPMIRLKRHRQLLAQPAALGYMTPEEKELVEGLIGPERAQGIPSAVLGTELAGIRPGDAQLFRDRFGIAQPFFLYLGRLERSKGCPELFRRWRSWWESRRFPAGRAPLLLLAGKRFLSVPPHPALRPLGFLSEEDKAGALAACEALILPSRRESLSIVVLEAWAQKRPVIAHAGCRPVAGQIGRALGGLLYRDQGSFNAAMEKALNRGLGARLGEAGRTYLEREYGPGRLRQNLRGLLARLGWLAGPAAREDAETFTATVKREDHVQVRLH
ncbi:MAG: glycosyltransferase [Planctomycetes bacterium]|nr:glycosyltransferase [Planctomycetota bacterium]